MHEREELLLLGLNGDAVFTGHDADPGGFVGLIFVGSGKPDDGDDQYRDRHIKPVAVSHAGRTPSRVSDIDTLELGKSSSLGRASVASSTGLRLVSA